LIYDAITVGGGLAGATLAKNLAERGYRVLVLERESRFKDRVRGEQMHPWGVSAARQLGVYDRLAATCGNQTRWWTTWIGGNPVFNRDLEMTAPHGVGSFNVYHPAMQEELLKLAQDAGAKVRRGAIVESVAPGQPARVQFRADGSTVSLDSRVIVGADGRNSQVRSWAGFSVSRDPDRLMIAGLLLEGVPAPEDATHLGVGMAGSTLIAPLGGKRARAYFLYRKGDGVRALSGERKIDEFMECCRSTGAPAAWWDSATPAGPLAEFNGADHWVDEPARDGVALIGDAAAASDPNWGTGLSLTLLDVLHLRDALCSSSDWNSAIHQYAVEHDRTYSVVHEATRCWAELVWTTGPAADERRNRVLSSLLTAPRGVPDVIGLGPESPVDEQARALLLGQAGATYA
jgi:2-polyprenyl-6-methoxyphenol hydroxylase-like FAD-dependent oxidoreductase